MYGLAPTTSTIRLGLTLALLSCVAGQAEAGSLCYQNLTNLVVMVQGSSTDNRGVVHKGAPHEINPKEGAFDQVATAGPKTITIYDPKKANVVYFQGTINFTGKDQIFAIQFDNNAMGAAGGAPRVKLVPVVIPAVVPKRKR